MFYAINCIKLVRILNIQSGVKDLPLKLKKFKKLEGFLQIMSNIVIVVQKIDEGVNVIMKMKKTIWSVAAATLLVATLSFGASASATNDQGGGSSGGYPSKPPTCVPGKACPIPV